MQDLLHHHNNHVKPQKAQHEIVSSTDLPTLCKPLTTTNSLRCEITLQVGITVLVVQMEKEHTSRLKNPSENHAGSYWQ